ncbi:MAG: DUF2393 family protein [Acidobacteria bacterium]|nr:DUF2393 family protein [Acidobacteriota bacterium]
MIGDETKPEQRSTVEKIGIALAVVAIVATLAIMLVVRRNHATPAGPEQVRALDAYASNLAISNVTMSEAEAVRISAKSLYVDGTLENKGDKTLTGVSVQAVFHGADGGVVFAETTPLRLVRQREPYVDLQEISAAPIAPGQLREFRLIFEGVPESWNGQPPEIRVVRTVLK